MNLKLITEIISSPALEQEQKENLILLEIAKNERALPYVLEILAAERRDRRELISDMNMELSRAHTIIRDKKFFRKMQEFVDDEIIKFYQKYKAVVGHCFANCDKPIKRS